MATWSAVDDSVMDQFMGWLAAAGQPGGAPVGVVVQDVRSAINTVNGPDTTAPVTTALCNAADGVGQNPTGSANGTPCQGTYGGSVKVSLTATDAGGVGVAATYFTTDGSTPTTSSSKYGTPFLLLQTTTVKFFSVDNAGNAEAVESQTIQVGSNPDPVIAAAGDIACDPDQAGFNGGDGTNTDCRALGTSNLLAGADAVLPIGDTQYFCGGYQPFLESYDPTWGRYKSISYPVLGDNDISTTGGTDCPATAGAGYQQYFGSTAGVSGSAVPSVVNLAASAGYYSYNLGSWHIIALNSGACVDTPAFCAAGSAQELWLENDLAHDTSACTLAYTAAARFASPGTDGESPVEAMRSCSRSGRTCTTPASTWSSAHNHWYERFEPLNANGTYDPAHGDPRVRRRHRRAGA